MCVRVGACVALRVCVCVELRACLRVTPRHPGPRVHSSTSSTISHPLAPASKRRGKTPTCCAGSTIPVVVSWSVQSQHGQIRHTRPGLQIGVHFASHSTKDFRTPPLPLSLLMPAELAPLQAVSKRPLPASPSVGPLSSESSMLTMRR